MSEKAKVFKFNHLKAMNNRLVIELIIGKIHTGRLVKASNVLFKNAIKSVR